MGWPLSRDTNRSHGLVSAGVRSVAPPDRKKEIGSVFLAAIRSWLGSYVVRLTYPVGIVDCFAAEVEGVDAVGAPRVVVLHQAADMFFREEDTPVEVDRVGGIAIDGTMIDPLGGERVQTWVYAAFGSLAECGEVFYVGSVVEPHEIRWRDIVDPASLDPGSGIETQPGALDKTRGCSHAEDKWGTSAFQIDTIQHFPYPTN